MNTHITVTDRTGISKGRDLRGEIRRINEIVPFPPVVAEILDAMHDKNVTASKVTALIESDPALTARILRSANSPFYGLRADVVTVEHAMRMLGLEEIGHLLLAAQMKSRLSALDPRQRERTEALWRHSVAAAAVARLIVREHRLPTDGKEYTAALLHDMGKLVLIQYYPKECAVLEELIEDLCIDDVEAERQTIQVPHTEIGRQLGEQWRLPKEYIEVMLHHHQPERSPSVPVLTAVVRMADLMCESWGDGIGEPDEGSTQSFEACTAVLAPYAPALREVHFYDMREHLQQELAKQKEMMEALA